MSIIKVARGYHNQAGVINKAGILVGQIADSVLVLTGERAWASVAEKLGGSLSKAAVRMVRVGDSGYPTLAKAKELARLAGEDAVGAVIGVGGGRALDLAKGAAAIAGLPFVAIPTVAATCAAFSDLTVYYHQDGAQDFYSFSAEPPRLIIADPDLLLAAPLRYLHSGIADSIAKFYEVQSTLNANRDDLLLGLQIKISELIREALEYGYIPAYRENGGKVDELLQKNSLDAIIMLAGLVGAVKGNVAYNGFGHLLYNQYTKLGIEASRRRLHGEVVCYGLAVQWVVEGKSDEYINRQLSNFKLLGQPVTLSELGMSLGRRSSRYISPVSASSADGSAQVFRLAKLMKEYAELYSSTAESLSAGAIADAIRKVDALGQAIG